MVPFAIDLSRRYMFYTLADSFPFALVFCYCVLHVAISLDCRVWLGAAVGIDMPSSFALLVLRFWSCASGLAIKVLRS